MEVKMRLRIDVLSAGLILLASVPSARSAEEQSLRVCAQSDNFPLSDRQGDGFENKLAVFVAAKMERRLAYTWWPARENFLDSTLKAKKCDVVMDAPPGLVELSTTHPYYRGAYVFVSRADAHLSLAGIRDAKLRRLKIGVYLIGDDQTPPALALSEQGINDNVRGYMTFFDRSNTGDSELISAVADGKLDVAAVWNPLVGYYVRHSSVPLATTVMAGSFGPLPFQFDIAMGVRKGDTRLRNALDKVIAENSGEIKKLLASYGVLDLLSTNATLPIAVSTVGRRQP
jgi:mxaJ protein